LHGDEVASAVLANFVDGADIRVVQSGSRARFALKTVEREGIFFRLGRQEFEGDMPAQVHVLRFVDNTHPSATQLREDTVVRDGLADHSGEHSWERVIHVRPAASGKSNLRVLPLIRCGTWGSSWLAEAVLCPVFSLA